MGETVHRTLVLLGLAQEDEDEPVEETQLEALERQVAENTAEIEALRTELERLREHG
jgi:hypothetical protein